VAVEVTLFLHSGIGRDEHGELHVVGVGVGGRPVTERRRSNLVVSLRSDACEVRGGVQSQDCAVVGVDIGGAGDGEPGLAGG
jgi:hypothetical protein